MDHPGQYPFTAQNPKDSQLPGDRYFPFPRFARGRVVPGSYNVSSFPTCDTRLPLATEQRAGELA